MKLLRLWRDVQIRRTWPEHARAARAAAPDLFPPEPETIIRATVSTAELALVGADDLVVELPSGERFRARRAEPLVPRWELPPDHPGRTSHPIALRVLWPERSRELRFLASTMIDALSENRGDLPTSLDEIETLVDELRRELYRRTDPAELQPWTFNAGFDAEAIAQATGGEADQVRVEELQRRAAELDILAQAEQIRNRRGIDAAIARVRRDPRAHVLNPPLESVTLPNFWDPIRPSPRSEPTASPTEPRAGGAPPRRGRQSRSRGGRR